MGIEEWIYLLAPFVDLGPNIWYIDWKSWEIEQEQNLGTTNKNPHMKSDGGIILGHLFMLPMYMFASIKLCMISNFM